MSSDIISNLRLPGETVKIPSSGLLYDDGVFAEGVKDGDQRYHQWNSHNTSFQSVYTANIET